jgi:hypothetical protein
VSFVANEPRAISYVPAHLVKDSVKVLRIDDRAPGEKSYPLTRP